MNLYLFNDNDSAATYGIGAYINELSQALDGANIKVHIVHLHSKHSEFEVQTCPQNCNVENWYIPDVFNVNTISDSIQNFENYYLNIGCLLRLYIKDKTDLIFHFNYNNCHLLAKELKAAFECKTVATVHFVRGLLVLNGNYLRWQSLLKKPVYERSSFEQKLISTEYYESMLFKEVDKVIALSQYTRNYLCNDLQVNPERVTVIPNGLEDVLIENGELRMDNVWDSTKNVLREKWHLTQKEKTILFVGRLHQVKGLSFLIKAFRQVLENMPDCRLIIAGNGDFDTYMQEAKDICMKITFTGLLEKNELHELYQLADVGILPSLTEQCSYVVMEMMMHGLPIITSTASGLAEMTEDGISGLHVPLIETPEKIEVDSEALAEKLLHLLKNSSEAKRLGINARKRYEQIYSIDVFRKNMLDFYQSLFK